MLGAGGVAVPIAALGVVDTGEFRVGMTMVGVRLMASSTNANLSARSPRPKAMSARPFMASQSV